MLNELSWYEVVDLTSFVIKYPTDWYYKNGHNYNMREAPVCENIGRYSTEEKAIARLRKFAESKGIDFEKNSEKCDSIPYYENNYGTECVTIFEVGIWFNIHDEPAKTLLDRIYGTGAMVVKKSIILDEDF